MIHREGVVHRDLTPRNVMIADGVPVVIDLGIAQTLDGTRITQGVIGTAGYVAPEMIEGERAGPAADVFAWAVTVVFAATGRQCFGGRTTAEILNNVLTRRPDLTGVPEEILETVERAPWTRIRAVESLSAYELAFAAEGRGDHARAEWLYERVRRLALQDGDRRTEAYAFLGLGTCAAGRGATAQAIGLLREALRIAEQIGDQEARDWAIESMSALQ